LWDRAAATQNVIYQSHVLKTVNMTDSDKNPTDASDSIVYRGEMNVSGDVDIESLPVDLRVEIEREMEG